MNQVIRIIFDDDVNYEFAKDVSKLLEQVYGTMAAISLSEREYEDGEEQRQEEPE